MAQLVFDVRRWVAGKVCHSSIVPAVADKPRFGSDGILLARIPSARSPGSAPPDRRPVGIRPFVYALAARSTEPNFRQRSSGVTA
jgi:hypothetical protein